MSVSLVPAGSSAVPRTAAAWLRTTAVPCLSGAADQVQTARAGAGAQFTGLSGRAYGVHANRLTLHLLALRERVTSAAALFEAYADRLAAHEHLLDGVRHRARAAGLQVVGDQLLAPGSPADLTASVQWSQLASEVLEEHESLTTWVVDHLHAAVHSFVGEETEQFVVKFLEAYHSTLVAGTLATALTSRGIDRLVEADRVAHQRRSGHPAVAAEGHRAVAAGEVRALKEAAERLDQLARVPGPVSVAYDTYRALESDEPSRGLMGVLGGTTLGTLGVMGAAAIGAPVLTSGVAVVGATILGAAAAGAAWGALPDEMQDSADEIISGLWDGVEDGWDAVTPW